MKKMNAFRPYRKGDTRAVWSDLREEDLREYQALGLTDPDVIEDFLLGMRGKVIVWDTEEGPVALIGVTPGAAEGEGCIWAIASNRARPRWRFAARATPRLLRILSSGFSVLSNFKDARNTQQIDWLRRLGFTFIATDSDYGGSGVPFHQFVRIVQ